MKFQGPVLLTLVVWVVTLSGYADTFTHKESGQSFDGFVTQKTMGDKTRVYNSAENQMVTISLADYNLTPNRQGRKEIAVVVPITQSESLLSEVVAKQIAESIVDASNRGAQVIIVHIDSPGGRGDYMQIVASAIEKTTNCPVVAYISGDAYGGAFSAAAVLALACDRIYIAPTAAMGAIGPMSDLAATPEEFESYISTYASDALLLQRLDANAERYATDRKRPALLARALIDKKLSVIEVKDLEKGQLFVEKGNLQPTQTVVRTLSQGAADTTEATSTAVDIVRSTLNLSAKEAVAVGFADEIAGSYYDILTARNLSDVKISSVSAIQATLKKYQAARRNIEELLARINYLEKQAGTLESQVAFIDEQLRTGLETREVQRGSSGIYRSSSRSRDTLPDNYDSYYYDPLRVDSTITGGVANRTSGRNNRRTESVGTETVTTAQPTTNLADAQRELAQTLEELLNVYRQVINLAKRWPGSLPPGMRYQTLEQNTVSIRSSLDYLYQEIRQSGRQDGQSQNQRQPGRMKR